MDIESAKLLGAGIAVLGVIGSGIGIGSIFSAFIQITNLRKHVQISDSPYIVPCREVFCYCKNIC